MPFATGHLSATGQFPFAAGHFSLDAGQSLAIGHLLFATGQLLAAGQVFALSHFVAVSAYDAAAKIRPAAHIAEIIFFINASFLFLVLFLRGYHTMKHPVLICK